MYQLEAKSRIAYEKRNVAKIRYWFRENKINIKSQINITRNIEDHININVLMFVNTD